MVMPGYKLRRCDRCNRYHASYVVDDPQRGKINLCYDCWSAQNRSIGSGAQALTIQAILADPPIRISKLDLQTLLAHLFNQSRAWVLAHPEAALSSEQTREWKASLRRLRRGVPLSYVLGHWEFFGLEFLVTPEVLIPRPETELLVETALSWIRQPHSAMRSCIDIGTGCGCIAISLALHAPMLTLTATDISPDALAVARANAEKHGVTGRIQFRRSDLFESVALRNSYFNLLVANLPYIPSSTLLTLEVYGREPGLALDGGPDGLRVIRQLLASAPAHLEVGGGLLLEIEASQGAAFLELARQAFPDANIQVLPDLAGKDRLLTIKT